MVRSSKAKVNLSNKRIECQESNTSKYNNTSNNNLDINASNTLITGINCKDSIESYPYLVSEALKLGAVLDGETVVSTGFITLTVNEDKAKTDVLGAEDLEVKQVEAFREYRVKLADQRCLVESLDDHRLAKLVRPADGSRYFKAGRKRVKAKIYKRLGRWYNCSGLLLSLTFAPSRISRAEAWRKVGLLRREFMNRVNRWRQRHGMTKAKYLAVIEEQPGTGYPHVHLVFPNLKYLATIEFLTETWGQDVNSVDIKVKNSLSPVSYVCKYVSKLDGWTDRALSYIWCNSTRLYSMSQDYRLPDYSDKRVNEWYFKRCLTKAKAVFILGHGLAGYETILNTDDLTEDVMRSLN